MAHPNFTPEMQQRLAAMRNSKNGQQNNGSPATDSAKNGPKHKKHKHMKAAIAQRLKKVQGK